MKFKVGDKVRCIESTGLKGMGWKECLEFTIDHFRPADSFCCAVYFPKDGHGVYERALELVEEKINFKRKGTKLPDIPAETPFRCKYWTGDDQGMMRSYEGFISYGEQLYEGKEYILAEKIGYEHSLHFMIPLSEIKRLAKEQGMIKETVKTKQNNVEITRKQLKNIHDVACFAWQNKIEDYATRNPWGDTIEFTQKEIVEMFDAATSSQKEVLEVIFGKQTKEIDLSKGNVDGLEIFNKNGTMNTSLMVVRSKKEYANKAFLLNGNYNWEIVTDSVGCKCLVPTRK